MYIAKKETNGFTIHLMTERGNTYQWSETVYATEAKVQRKLGALNGQLAA